MTDPTLLVPIEVVALPVTESRVVAQIAHTFEIVEFGVPWLGEHAEPEPFAPASTQLGAGVHLHWLLPSGLTRGAASGTGPIAGGGGTPTFPEVPNRWLITRTATVGPVRRWVLEGDLLWDGRIDAADRCAKQNRLSPTVPYVPAPGSVVADDEPYCRYLGRAYDADTWVERSTAPADEERHHPHTALGYGSPTFAAALPQCYNVFGFYDPLDAGEVGPLSYSVVGWWSDEARDPASSSEETWGSDLGWQWPASTGPTPTATVLGGHLKDVVWSAGSSSDQNRPVVHVEVAVGSTDPETLSALIAAQAARAAETLPGGAQPPLPGLERHLNLIQADLLDQSDTPGFLKRWSDALHQDDFSPIPGGTIWTLKQRSNDPDPGQGTGLPTVVERKLAELLDAVNVSQAAVDIGLGDLEAARSRLFADWCNHVALRHPSTDDQPAWLRQGPSARWLSDGVAAIKALVDQIGKSASERQQKMDELDAQLAGPTVIDLQLVPVAAPRFWHPNEPIVLIAGENALRSTSALPRVAGSGSTPGPLACELVEEAHSGGFDRATAATGRLKALTSDVRSAWSQVWAIPRRPLLLQWEAVFEPDEVAAAAYDPRLLLHDPVFDPDDENELPFCALPDPSRRALYRGSVVLTGGASTSRIAEAFAGTTADDQAAHAEVEALVSLSELPPLLSQRLSGFNAALLGRRQTLQLPVFDPYEPADEPGHEEIRPDGDERPQTFRRLVSEVAEAVAGSNDQATLGQPMNVLRSGHLSISRLWLLDSFGQVAVLLGDNDEIHDFPTGDLRVDQIVRAKRFQANPDAPTEIALRPRLVQPSRLLFRFRSAQDDRTETNSLPSTTPVFGWLVGNHLENTLAVFEADGTALGSFDVDGTWTSAPGPSAERSFEDLWSGRADHLAAFAFGLHSTPLGPFLDAIEEQGQYVVPNRHAQYDGLSILVGQPLALVRASLDFQVQGGPPVDPGSAAYAKTLRAGVPDSHRLERLQIPMRLGDKDHLNDGLIGFFRDVIDPTTYEPITDYGTLYVEDHDSRSSPGVALAKPEHLACSPTDPPRVFTLLLDPRAPVHAATGLLPVKQIELPPALVADALRQIAVTFPVMPVLQPAAPVSSVRLATPTESGREWRFISTPSPDVWPEPQTITPVDDVADLSQYPIRIVDGWLRLQQANPDGSPQNPTEKGVSS